MVQRWYRAYRTRGTPDAFLNRILHTVVEHDLHDYIPEVCFERQSRQFGVREFYMFLGINSDEMGQLPERVIPYLELLHLGHDSADVSFEDIERMISGPIEMRSYARSIPYHAPERPQFEDPFGASSKGVDPNPSVVEGLNKLLYWLSAVGAGTWNTFVKACQALSLTSAGLDPRHIARRFRLLGHLEYLDGGQRWSVSPACIVTSAGQNGTAFLAGQRTPHLLNCLTDLANVTIEAQKKHDGPDVVLLNLESEYQLEKIMPKVLETCQFRLWDAGIAAEKLATALQDLDDYRMSLSPTSLIPSRFIIHKWQNGEFQETSFDNTSGMYRVTQQGDHQDNHQFTLYYDAPNKCWRQGDWYGIRYLAAQESNMVCQAHLRKGILAIPANLRWPDYYERALVLASGRLPKQEGDWMYFENVSPRVGHTLSQKLHSQFYGEG